MSAPKTKNAALELGFRGESELECNLLAPKNGASPIIIESERFYHPSDVEELVSKTEAKNRRLSVPKTAKSVRTMRGHWGEFKVYRLSDCVPIGKRKTVPPTALDLLQAIYTVNKSAKRYRNAAQACYRKKKHGFATKSREQKDDLYTLKDRGIVAACRQNRLSFVGVNGNLGLYRGEGYCFHSTLVPEACEMPERQEPVFIEPAPKGGKESLLKDAVHTLQSLGDDTSGFRTLPAPTIVSERKPTHVGLVSGADSDLYEDEGFMED